MLNLDTRQCEKLYNINDPDCTGSFGTCTQEDKTRLGYASIKKLHGQMDEDNDGGIEVHETKDFIKEDLQLKNGNSPHEKQNANFKDTDGDGSISVDELWKSWEYSAAYNWTTDEMVLWLTEHLNLPMYEDNFRRNLIDGQFLPRLVANENHYYSNVLHIKDSRHKRLIIVKATDIVLFGVPQRPYSVIKDIIMIGVLTISIFICIYLYRQNRKSSEQIKQMLIEFDKLSTSVEISEIEKLNTNTPLELIRLQKRDSVQSIDGLVTNIVEKQTRSFDESGSKSRKSSQDDENNSLYKLQIAEQELERMRNALRKTESRLDLIKYQPPLSLINLLNKTYESEKALLDFKLSMIEKDKNECVSHLNKVCKNQSGFMGAFKIAHSSTLESIQHKLEGLKTKHFKLKLEQQESTKRWNQIFEMCVRNETVPEISPQETR